MKRTKTEAARKICILLVFVLLLSGASQAMEVRTVEETNPRNIETDTIKDSRLIGVIEGDPYSDENPPLDPEPCEDPPYIDNTTTAPPLDPVREEDLDSLVPGKQMNPPLDPRDENQITVDANMVTVTYGGNGNTGGTVPSSHSINTPGKITLKGPGTMVKTGYVFNGWRHSGGGLYTAGQSFDYPAGFNGSLTLNAEWIPVSSTPTPTPKATATLTPKPTATPTPKPTATPTPKPTATPTPKPTATPTPKATATPTPTPAPKVTVYYNGNENTGGTVPASHFIYTPGTITLQGPGTMVKTGYVFNGWRHSGGGLYKAGASFSYGEGVNGKLTLNAEWVIPTPSPTPKPTATPTPKPTATPTPKPTATPTPLPKVTIVYSCEFSDGGKVPDSHFIYTNTAASITLKGPGTMERSGYVFRGWKHSNGTIYQPGRVFNYSAGTNGSVSLKAHWVENVAARVDIYADNKYDPLYFLNYFDYRYGSSGIVSCAQEAALPFRKTIGIDMNIVYDGLSLDLKAHRSFCDAGCSNVEYLNPKPVSALLKQIKDAKGGTGLRTLYFDGLLHLGCNFAAGLTDEEAPYKVTLVSSTPQTIVPGDASSKVIPLRATQHEWSHSYGIDFDPYLFNENDPRLCKTPCIMNKSYRIDPREYDSVWCERCKDLIWSHRNNHR